MTWKETPVQAAEREGKEETGLSLKVDDLINVYAGPSNSWFTLSSVCFVYHAAVRGGQLQKNVEGNPRWITEEELRHHLDEFTGTILKDYLHYRERRKNSADA